MTSRLRLVSIALGALFLLQGLGWFTVPARAAAGLGMPLLEGLARSTQIGDLGAFFVVLGLFTLLGALRREPMLLHVGAALVGAAAIGRTLAWLLHGADFAFLFILIEVVAAGILVATAAALPPKS